MLSSQKSGLADTLERSWWAIEHTRIGLETGLLTVNAQLGCGISTIVQLEVWKHQPDRKEAGCGNNHTHYHVMTP